VPTADQIVQVAAELFMELGYRAVTMEMVAERAGVTKAAVYYHFTDKPALLTEGLIAMFRRVRKATDRILGNSAPLRDRLVSLAEAMMRLPEPLTRVDLLLRVARDDLSQSQLAAIRQVGDGVDAAVIAAIREGMGSGAVRAVDAELLGHVFMTLVRVGHTRGATGDLRFPDPAETAGALVDMLWRGVAADEGPIALEPPAGVAGRQARRAVARTPRNVTPGAP
jgi:TetR/AcrR family transcriptional regulator, mexJK operon transcriptional repressor